MAKTTHHNLTRIGQLAIAASLLVPFGYALFHQHVMGILARFVSPDHQISAHGEEQFTAALYFVTVLLFGLGLGLLKARDATWLAQVKHAVCGRALSSHPYARTSPCLLLVVSSLSGLFLVINMGWWKRFPAFFTMLYQEDGVFESLTPVSLTVSAGLLGTTVWRLLKDSALPKQRRLWIALHLLLMGLFILGAMEEISWGQRIFRWGTPALFAANVQHETNLHNFFNAAFPAIYRTLAVLPLVVLTSAWLETKQRWPLLRLLVLPQPSLIGLSLLISFVAIVWHEEQELLEELAALFIVFYSHRIFSGFPAEVLRVR